jgi:hypothetical protein
LQPGPLLAAAHFTTEETTMTPIVRNAALALTLLALPAMAAIDIAGVKFEDKTQAGAAELSLNGAGLRKKAFFKVYAIGLYLAERKNSADGVLAAKGAKRIHIVTLRDLTAEQFADALMDALRDNNTAAELAAIKPAADEFRATLLSLKSAPSGTTIVIDCTPEGGTQLAANGQPRGKAIAGEDFQRALLKVWLGSKPVQDDLKDALLGVVR